METLTKGELSYEILVLSDLLQPAGTQGTAQLVELAVDCVRST